MAANGCAAVAAGADAAAADEPELREIGIVAVEVVDPGSQGARAHERIEVSVFRKQCRDPAHRLIGVVASYDTCVALEIVRLTDLRMQHEVHVAEYIRRKDHQVRGLLELAATSVEIRDADCAL